MKIKSKEIHVHRANDVAVSFFSVLVIKKRQRSVFDATIPLEVRVRVVLELKINLVVLPCYYLSLLFDSFNFSLCK